MVISAVGWAERLFAKPNILPRSVEMSGLMVDMVAQSLWAKNNDAKLSRAVGQQVGMMGSAFEHRIPELFFTNEQNPGEAVSAVKALAIASAQGQKIYRITAGNVSVLGGLNIGDEVKDEIRASVAVGKEATVSESMISVGGWTGVGFIVTDPETGSGAYRISGGGNGGIITLGFGSLLLALALYGAILVPGLGIILLVLAFAAIQAMIFIRAEMDDEFRVDWDLYFFSINFSLWSIGGLAKGATAYIAWFLAGIYGFVYNKYP